MGWETDGQTRKRQGHSDVRGNDERGGRPGVQATGGNTSKENEAESSKERTSRESGLKNIPAARARMEGTQRDEIQPKRGENSRRKPDKRAASRCKAQSVGGVQRIECQRLGSYKPVDVVAARAKPGSPPQHERRDRERLRKELPLTAHFTPDI